MKKIGLFLGLCLLKTSSIQALLIEGKVGFFHPDSSVLREIYASWIPNYQVELSHPLWKDIHFWTSANYLFASGRSLGGHQSTQLHMGSLTLGFEYLYSFSGRVKGYAGVGPRYFFVHIRNDSHFVSKTNNKNGLGGCFRAGSLIYCTPRLILDAFLDYSLKKMSFSGSTPTVEKHNLDISGLSLGLGLGYAF